MLNPTPLTKLGLRLESSEAEQQNRRKFLAGVYKPSKPYGPQKPGSDFTLLLSRAVTKSI